MSDQRHANELATRWARLPLSSFAAKEANSFVDGPFGSDLKVSDYSDEGVRILQLQNLGDGFFIDDNKKFTTNRKAQSLARCLVRPDDLLIAKMADPLARACRVPRYLETALIVADVIKLRPTTEADPRFLVAAINSYEFRNEAERLSTGTTRSRISLSALKRIRLPNPSTLEQTKIGLIAEAIDSAIDHTEALIAKHQQIKAGLMHDLFTRGLDANGELRPSREAAPELYKDSPLGWIPNNWSTTTLEACADVDRGKFTARPRDDPKFYGGNNPFIQTGDVAASIGRTLTSYSQTLNKQGVLVSKSFPVGTIMITIAANIADTCILGIPMFAPDSLVGAIPKPGQISRFLELCIRARKQFLSSRAPQSAQKNINLKDLRPLRIPKPLPGEQAMISDRYDALDEFLESLESEQAKLLSIKQGLMGDLLTGNVSVKAGHQVVAPIHV